MSGTRRAGSRLVRSRERRRTGRVCRPGAVNRTLAPAAALAIGRGGRDEAGARRDRARLALRLALVQAAGRLPGPRRDRRRRPGRRGGQRRPHPAGTRPARDRARGLGAQRPKAGPRRSRPDAAAPGHEHAGGLVWGWARIGDPGAPCSSTTWPSLPWSGSTPARPPLARAEQVAKRDGAAAASTRAPDLRSSCSAGCTRIARASPLLGRGARDGPVPSRSSRPSGAVAAAALLQPCPAEGLARALRR